MSDVDRLRAQIFSSTDPERLERMAQAEEAWENKRRPKAEEGVPDTLIEAVAKAIKDNVSVSVSTYGDPLVFDEQEDAARAALAAIVAQGYRVVPVIPTDTMSAAARDASVANGSPASKGPEDVYAAMLAAAPKVTP